MKVWKFWLGVIFGFTGAGLLRLLVSTLGWLGVYVFFLLFLYFFLIILLLWSK